MGSKLSKSRKEKKAGKNAEAEKAEPEQTKTEKVQVVEEQKEEAAPAEEKKAEVAPAEEKKEAEAEAAPAEEKKEEEPAPAAEEKKEAEGAPVEKAEAETAAEVVAPVESAEATEATEATPAASPFVPIVGIDQLFANAHTAHGFQDKPVSDELLDKALEMAYLQPTAYNCSPMRVIYLQSPEAKQKLLDVLDEYAPNNKGQTSEAPVTAIICYDNDYEEQLPYLMPFVPNVKENVFSKEGPNHGPSLQVNSSLQGGYIIIALRAMGLDVGPMVAHPQKLHAAFLADDDKTKNYTPMFLLNIGYADPSKNYGRAPRLSPSTAKRF